MSRTIKVRETNLPMIDMMLPHNYGVEGEFFLNTDESGTTNLMFVDRVPGSVTYIGMGNHPWQFESELKKRSNEPTLGISEAGLLKVLKIMKG